MTHEIHPSNCYLNFDYLNFDAACTNAPKAALHSAPRKYLEDTLLAVARASAAVPTRDLSQLLWQQGSAQQVRLLQQRLLLSVASGQQRAAAPGCSLNQIKREDTKSGRAGVPWDKRSHS